MNDEQRAEQPDETGPEPGNGATGRTVNTQFVLWLSIGMAIGASLSIVLDNVAFIAVGIGVGVTLGLVLGGNRER